MLIKMAPSFAQEATHTLAFDLSHNEMVDLSGEGKDGLFHFIAAIKASGITVYALNDFTEEQVNRFSSIAILCPQKGFSDAELTILANYVQNGGGLILMGEWGGIRENTKILNNISKMFGVEFLADRVCDNQLAAAYKTIGKYTLKVNKPFNIKVSHFTPHPITNNVSSFGYYSGCSLLADDAFIIARGSEKSFSDTDFDSERQDWETGGYIAIMAAVEYGYGRVVCTGDNDVITNEKFEELDNKVIAINMANWVTKAI